MMLRTKNKFFPLNAADLADCNQTLLALSVVVRPPLLSQDQHVSDVVPVSGAASCQKLSHAVVLNHSLENSFAP